MPRSQLKRFLTALAFIILPTTVGCAVVTTTDTTNVRYFNRVDNALFNFNSVGTRFYKSRIQCIAACKQRDDCSSVNMKQAASESDMIECDFQQRATNSEANIEIDYDTTYYCKSTCVVPQQHTWMVVHIPCTWILSANAHKCCLHLAMPILLHARVHDCTHTRTCILQPMRKYRLNLNCCRPLTRTCTCFLKAVKYRLLVQRVTCVDCIHVH